MLSEAVRGLAAIILDAEPPTGGDRIPVAAEGEDHALLLAALLEEALWVFETRGDLPTSADVKVEVERGRAEGDFVVARGAAAAGPQIKAVTFHQLSVTERSGTWHATVYFDV